MSKALKKLIEGGESESLVLLAGRAGQDSVLRAICGLLNQQGGTVVWGVKSNGETTGVKDPESRAADLTAVVSSEISPIPLFSVSVESMGRQEVIVVSVPQGAKKPYSLHQAIWVHVGTQTMRASGDATASIVRESAVRLARWEAEPLPGYGLDDCDTDELTAARSDIDKSKRFGLELPEDDELFLRSLDLEKRGQLTNAAGYLFAQSPRTWSPNWSIRITTYIKDRQGPTDDDFFIVEPAVRAVRTAVNAVLKRTGISAEFVEGQLQRVERRHYPFFAIREGIVNAMVHRDFTSVGRDVRVEVFPDKLVIQNPGELPEGWTTENLWKTPMSAPQNPDIAHVFYLRGLMEKLGRGTQELIQACKGFGAKQPEWDVEKGSVLLTIYRAPGPSAESELSPRQSLILGMMKPGETYKANDFVKDVEVGVRQVRRELSELEDAGYIEKQGKGPATVYERIEQDKSGLE